MAPTPSLKLTKSFSFKGGLRSFSNRYHFLGGTPADDAHWDALVDLVVAAEALIYPEPVTISQAVGYGAGSDVPLYTEDLIVAGSFTPAGGSVLAVGEAAALVRYATDARSTKNHPIYCFNYYHSAYSDAAGGNPDNFLGSQRAVLETYAAAWLAGFSDGVHTYTRASPAGHACTTVIVDEFLTHRDFPYTRSI